MGKLKYFTISLANPLAVYYAGTPIQGHVTIELNEAMKMRGVRMEFEGKAFVRWKNRRAGEDTYHNKEKYFKQDVLLYGIDPSQGNDTSELPAGVHKFPFEFLLPQGLPSSFEWDEGCDTAYVRYMMSCCIDKPWKFDHQTKLPFTVISVLDLNQQPDCMRRVQAEKQKHLGCLCCKSGPITATFNIDRKGYVPGEAIKLCAEISNGSSRTISKTYVDLIMTVNMHSYLRSEKFTKRVARLTRPEIAAHTEDVWSGEALVIPPLPPSFLHGCKIIDVSYTVQLIVDPSGAALNLEVPLDVIIGTIPLASVVQQYPPLPPVGFTNGTAYNAGAWPPTPPMAPGSPEPLKNLPPPSYSESVFGKVDVREDNDKHTHGDLSFAPAYTYYNWGHKPSQLPA